MEAGETKVDVGSNKLRQFFKVGEGSGDKGDR